MAQLLFYENSHEYWVEDTKYPSVSEISRFVSREIYGEILQTSVDNAAERGKAVHKATENLDLYGKVEISEYANYVKTYMQFRKDFGIKKQDIFEIEKKLAHHELVFAGTLDRIITITEDFAIVFKKQVKLDISHLIGKKAIIDIKTSSIIKKPLAMIQLNAYKMLCDANNIKDIELLIILHLRSDNKYKLYNFDIDNTLFMACYTIHKSLEKKPKKIKKGGDGENEQEDE